MSDVKWIKITTDIFDDDKILLIECLPEADSLIVIWFKLLCLAGKQNNSGVFMLNDRIPYTEKMLATIFRRKESTVALALKTFEEFGMVEIVDGVITIPNWGKHQNLDQLESKKEYMKHYMRDYRAKQKMIASGENASRDKENICKANCNDNCKVNGKDNREANVSEADKNIDKEGDKEGEGEGLTGPKGPVCRTKDVRRIIEAWNSLGLQQVTKITGDSKRGGMLRARVNEYGVDAVLDAIEKVRESDFLKGQNSQGWVITFEWFVKPNNFVKVYEGNYGNKEINRFGEKKVLTFMDL